MNYSSRNDGTKCADHGCNDGHLAQGWGSGTADFPYLIDPLTGLTNALGKGVKIQSAIDDWDLKKAAEAAKGADVAFVFSTADSGEEYIVVDGNIGDRNNLSLWNNGDNLVNFLVSGKVKALLNCIYFIDQGCC